MRNNKQLITCKSSKTFFYTFFCLNLTFSKDRNIVVNFGAMLLRHTFGNPHNIPAFLLLQFQVGVENSKVELLHKGVHIQLDFVLEKLVFQCFFARVGARAFKALFVVRIIFSHTSDLLIIICSGQGLQTIWIKFTTSRIKLLPVILGQFGSKGINGDDKCPSICSKAKIWHMTSSVSPPMFLQKLKNDSKYDL